MTDYILAFGGGEILTFASWRAFIGVGLLALHAGWLCGVALVARLGR